MFSSTVESTITPLNDIFFTRHQGAKYSRGLNGSVMEYERKTKEETDRQTCMGAIGELD